MDLKIYRMFTRSPHLSYLAGVIDYYTRLLWVDKCNGYSTVSLTLPYDRVSMSYLQPGNTMTIPHSPNMMVIDRVVRDKKADSDQVTVTGSTPNALFNKKFMLNSDGYYSTWRETLEYAVISCFRDNPRNLPTLEFYLGDGLDVAVPADLVGTVFDPGTSFADVLASAMLATNTFLTSSMAMTSTTDVLFSVETRRNLTGDDPDRNPVFFSLDHGTLTSVVDTFREDIVPCRGVVYERYAWENGMSTAMFSVPDKLRGFYWGLSPEMFFRAEDSAETAIEAIGTIRTVAIAKATKEMMEYDFRPYERDAEVDPTAYTYGVDYYLGDIVNAKMDNDYDYSYYSDLAQASIDEVVISDEGNGLEIYPRLKY